MRFQLITLIVLFYSSAYGQETVESILFTENFENNNIGWSIKNTNRYTCNVTNENYELRLPDNSSGFTWVLLPEAIRKISNIPNQKIEFDLRIEDFFESRFRIGLMFDLHNVSSFCTGGDFFLASFGGEQRSQTITGRISQRQNCNWKSSPIRNYKAAIAPLEIGFNHFLIDKSGEHYDMYANGIRVLSFDFQGSFTFSNLYFEKGTYILDNFIVKSVKYNSNLVPSISNISQNDRPQIYVLCVGINNYDSPQNNQNTLQGCVNDVNSMFAFWRSTSGGRVSQNNIISLIDSRATINGILNNAAALFKRASSNDVIITFFSGHGSVGAFCAYDGSLPYERLNQIITKSAATNKLFIVDACHAGSWNVNSVLAAKGTKLSEEDALRLFYEKLRSNGSGMNWLLACRPDETSEDGENGVFTAALLNGLRGNADLNKDHIIELHELHKYLEHKFNQPRSKQHPQLVGNNRTMPIGVIY